MQLEILLNLTEYHAERLSLPLSFSDQNSPCAAPVAEECGV